MDSQQSDASTSTFAQTQAGRRAIRHPGATFLCADGFSLLSRTALCVELAVETQETSDATLTWLARDGLFAVGRRLVVASTARLGREDPANTFTGDADDPVHHPAREEDAHEVTEKGERRKTVA